VITGGDENKMAKFKLRQRVWKLGAQEVRTVEEIREGAGEPLYSIQLGRDFATRIWAKESELEADVPPATSPDALSRRCKECGFIGWVGEYCPNGHGELTEPMLA
jgi:hypothetical protein